MSFRKNLIKLQFKVDHASVPHRAAFLCVVLIMILIPGLFLSWLPQSHALARAKQVVKDLKAQTAQADSQREAILARANSDETKKLIVQYKRLNTELGEINQQLLHYHDGYIDEKKLAKIFYSTILNDIHDISIENFTTLPNVETIAASATSNIAALALPSASPATVSSSESLPPPEMTRYSLSLKGDYFSIMRTLKRLEDLNWQLFWDKFNYEVVHYPRAVVTIEFYMIKMPQKSVIPDAKQGAAI